jgi:hypothetical protein
VGSRCLRHEEGELTEADHTVGSGVSRGQTGILSILSHPDETLDRQSRIATVLL